MQTGKTQLQTHKAGKCSEWSLIEIMMTKASSRERGTDRWQEQESETHNNLATHWRTRTGMYAGELIKENRNRCVGGWGWSDDWEYEKSEQLDLRVGEESLSTYGVQMVSGQ